MHEATQIISITLCILCDLGGHAGGGYTWRGTWKWSVRSSMDRYAVLWQGPGLWAAQLLWSSQWSSCSFVEVVVLTTEMFWGNCSILLQWSCPCIDNGSLGSWAQRLQVILCDLSISSWLGWREHVSSFHQTLFEMHFNICRANQIPIALYWWSWAILCYLS